MVIGIIIALMIVLVILCLPYLYALYTYKFTKFSYVKVLKGETFKDQQRRARSKIRKMVKHLNTIVFLYLLASIVFVFFIPVQSKTIDVTDAKVCCGSYRKASVVMVEGHIFAFSDLDTEKYKYYFLDKYENLDFKLKVYKSTLGLTVSGPHLKIIFPIEEEIIF